MRGDRVELSDWGTLVGILGAGWAVVTARKAERRESAEDAEHRLEKTDARTREVIKLEIGEQLAEIKASLDTLSQSFGANVVRQTIESTSTVIYETAIKMLEIKQK